MVDGKPINLGLWDTAGLFFNLSQEYINKYAISFNLVRSITYQQPQCRKVWLSLPWSSGVKCLRLFH